MLNSRYTSLLFTRPPLDAAHVSLTANRAKGITRVVALGQGDMYHNRCIDHVNQKKQIFHIETADGEDASSIIHLFPEDQSALFDPSEMVK
jgi:hypothetical protein